MRHPSDPGQDAAGTLVSARDWLGNRFAVGDNVIYCVGAGRGQMMAIGRVVKLELAPLTYWQLDARERGHEVHPELRVQVLTAGTSGAWGNQARTRPAWVNPINVTALTGLAKHAAERITAARQPAVP